MKSCWGVKPDDRPSFSQLLCSLSSLLESMADYLDFLTLSNPLILDDMPSSHPIMPIRSALEEENDDDSVNDYVIANV